MPANVATNIRLPEEVLKALKYKAIEENKSVNQLIREAIEIALTTHVQPEKLAKDPFERVIGIAKSGIKDGSTKHDHYLYGKKK
jgi:predicted DNA-binding protein